MRTGTRRFASTGLLIMGVTTLVAVGCDKVPLTAPNSSTITLSAPTRTLPTGGSTQLSAIVTEPAGTPVQDGTTVLFQTNLGRLDPAEAHTRNGVATTVFFAGDVSGAAEVKALSGPAGSGSTTTATNAVTILIGNAAVGTVSVRSSAGSVPATGGTVDIVATVLSDGGTVGSGGTAVAGGPMPGVQVTFSTTRGTLSGTRELTDGNGEARTRLTTDASATVTATAGTKSGTVAIEALNPIPAPTISFGVPTAAAATTAGQLWSFSITVDSPTAIGPPVEIEWDFGDGVVIKNNSLSTSHVYTRELTVFTVKVKTTFGNGATATGSVDIITADFP